MESAESWRRALRDVLWPCRVVDEVDSTQSHAREIRAKPPMTIVALRQTRGRGRLGRSWLDTRMDGLAVTFALEPLTPEHMAIASAICVARALEDVTDRPFQIKWPNDVLAEGKKVAGILIEIERSTALIGVGVNVLQRDWPDELRERAISLAQLGAQVSRLGVLHALLERMSELRRLDDDALREAFSKRDVLLGTRRTLLHGRKTFTGVIRGIDPLRGLTIETPDGFTSLPAATTSLQTDPSSGR